MIKPKQPHLLENKAKNYIEHNKTFEPSDSIMQKKCSGNVLTDSYYRSSRNGSRMLREGRVLQEEEMEEDFISYTIPFALNVCNTFIKRKKVLNKEFFFLSFQFWNYENLKIDIFLKNKKKSGFSKRTQTFYYLKKRFYENKSMEASLEQEQELINHGKINKKYF
jgi:hypothetical protein